ncbi:MAG: hypothetical protein OXG35_16075 [Acidobacteria bacterium]|nr:hypothetical protein [Acidobacteriota bacterium]
MQMRMMDEGLSSSRLSTTGKDRGFFGTGITSSKTHCFRSVTR